jgi:AcrR family transcriptional regulator
MTTVMTKVMTVVTSANRGRPREDIRADLYETAIRLFRAQGYAATTVDAIVAGAGVAKGTFFNFFPSKLDVLKAYYATIDVEVARCRAAFNPDDPQRSLSRYARAVERILRREGALMIELLDVTFADPAMRRFDEDSGAADAAEFSHLLEAAKEKGLIGADVDTLMAATALVDLWSGAMRTWLRDPAKASLVKLFEPRAAILFDGLRGGK